MRMRMMRTKKRKKRRTSRFGFQCFRFSARSFLAAHCEEKVKKKGKEKGKDGKDGKDKTSKTNRKGKERTKEARHRHRHRMLCHLYKNPSRLRFRIERDVESPERTN